MTNAIESVVVLSRALDQTGDILTGIHEDQLTLPTPCGEWDVARLIAHVVASPRNFIEMARGEQPDWSAEPEPVGADWPAAFRSAADDLIHVWHEAGDSAEPTQVDWQTAEFALHAWDLARATGQSTNLDPDVALRGLAFMSGALTPENRGKAFGPEVPVPDDAPPYDRIAAFAGRDPR
ncbi:MAG: hypothetical protein JWO11_911 [Nocardioides sp.]|jgi:uncharacterized protein (TIGR03086 family)|nr:hypothetical protein [Nocardioides sp.]